jgi:DNA polymerase II large subunit
MGRPEKAKIRKLIGSPNVIFPVGDEGGRLRSVNAAVEKGFINGDFPFNYCEKCKKDSIYKICENCGAETIKKYFCKVCKCEMHEKVCPVHGNCVNFSHNKIDSKHYFEKAREKLGYFRTDVPVLIKGVRGTSSENHNIENLVKGILRAKYNLSVNKDGTVRYDMTELPISHFKPKEIEVSVEKLRELGYVKDCLGNELVGDEQILELKPHDIIIPCNLKCGDEKADDVFANVGNFIDELLEKFYCLPKFYNIKKREDIIGQLGVCMAPHNCAGVICRIIGFSKVQGLLASPYMHAAMRRDCVYPDTNFVYLDKDEIKNEKIGGFVEDLIKKGSKIKKIDSFGTEKIEISKEIYALGVDPNTKKITKKKIKHFIRGKVPEKWVRIRTATGREQIMTSRHKFIYLDEKNNFKTKTADEINVGDKIGLLKLLDINSKEIKNIFLIDTLLEYVPFDKLKDIRVVDAKDYFKKLVEKIGEDKLIKLLNLKDSFKNLKDWYNIVPLSHIKILIKKGMINLKNLPPETKLRTIFNNKKWDLNLEITPELMRILGWYSSEGYCRQTKKVSQVCFRIMEENQKRIIVNTIKKCFGITPSLCEDNTKITICNKLIYFLFRYCLNAGSSAYKKRVPNILYNISKDLVQEYLSGFFDGDGTIIFNKRRKIVCFYSVSRELLDGISYLCSRFGLFGRFLKTKPRFPGKKVLDRYKELGKEPKSHILNHLIYTGQDFYEIVKILKSVDKRKSKIISKIEYRKCKGRLISFDNHLFSMQTLGDIFIDFVKEVNYFQEDKNSYCFEIEWKSEEDKNVLWGEQIINARCDGDEAALMLLLDVLINFSRGFLPSHRGGTQDAPLVLNGKIYAREVDDQILDFELVNNYPLELYEKAERKLHSKEVKIEMVKQRIARDEDPYIHTGFTHDSENFNAGATCSSYKTLPTMKEKVQAQMDLCVKLRSVDQGDVARLIIDRHFMKDLKGNLRKFTQQNFRCSTCNTIFRRPPLNGKCTSCNGKIIFTISYGSIVKYLEPALDLVKNYNVPAYIKQDLELTKKYIESIFGRDSEKQEGLGKWF